MQADDDNKRISQDLQAAILAGITIALAIFGGGAILFYRVFPQFGVYAFFTLTGAVLFTGITIALMVATVRVDR